MPWIEAHGQRSDELERSKRYGNGVAVLEWTALHVGVATHGLNSPFALPSESLLGPRLFAALIVSDL
jgi:hypothetical protein